MLFCLCAVSNSLLFPAACYQLVALLSWHVHYIIIMNCCLLPYCQQVSSIVQG